MNSPSELEEQIASLKHGDHVCMVYESPREQAAAAVPFIKQGLERAECCLYVADDQTIAAVRESLIDAGVAVDQAMSRGALSLLTKREAYLRSGSFDPKGMVQLLKDSVENALKDGFSGFRVTGEMTWALGCEHGCEQLIEYEALLNEFFPKSRALAICQYSRERFSAAVIHDVLRTHPLAILGEQVCPNIYYEPPDLVLGRKSIDFKVEWMMQQLKVARQAELQVKKFNKELEAKVRARTLSLEESKRQLEHFCYSLSHDLKAPIRTLQSFSDILQQDYGNHLDSEGQLLCNRIKLAAKKLREMVEGLLEFYRISSEEQKLEPLDLASTVREVCEELKLVAEASRATFELPEETPGVWGSPTITKAAISNLLSNAVKFVPEGRVPHIRIWSEERGEFVRLWVEDNGIGIAAEHHEKLFRILSVSIRTAGIPAQG